MVRDSFLSRPACRPASPGALLARVLGRSDRPEVSRRPRAIAARALATWLAAWIGVGLAPALAWAQGGAQGAARAENGEASETLHALDVEGRPKRQLALFRTASLDPKLQELGAALDPVVLSELNTIGDIEVAARPSLDLPAMQLAIDCVGQIAECMAAVTREAGVEALVAPVLRSQGDQVLVTLLYFDVHENQVRGVTRQLSGRSVAQAMLDAVPGMVREAFGVSSEPRAEAIVPAAPTADARAEARSRRHRRVALAVPITLGGVGVALLASGIGLGVASQHHQDAYGKAPTATKSQIDHALDKLHTAQHQALAANLCFGIGGAALVASLATWLYFRFEARGSAREPEAQRQARRVSLVPSLSRYAWGLSLEGSLGR
jgi:hypothetical protein